MAACAPFFSGDALGEMVAFGSGVSFGVGDAADLRLVRGPGVIGRTGSTNCDCVRLKAVGAGCGVAVCSGDALAA